MADPAIRSVTPSELTLTPGQSVAVVGDAYHPDDKTVVGEYAVEGGGGKAKAPVNVTFSHPLTHSLTFDDPKVKVAPDKDNPARFTVTYAG